MQQLSSSQFELSRDHVFSSALTKLGIPSVDENILLATPSSGRVSRWHVVHITKDDAGRITSWVFTPSPEEAKLHPRLAKFSLIIINS